MNDYNEIKYKRLILIKCTKCLGRNLEKIEGSFIT